MGVGLESAAFTCAMNSMREYCRSCVRGRGRVRARFGFGLGPGLGFGFEGVLPVLRHAECHAPVEDAQLAW